MPCFTHTCTHKHTQACTDTHAYVHTGHAHTCTHTACFSHSCTCTHRHIHLSSTHCYLHSDEEGDGDLGDPGDSNVGDLGDSNPAGDGDLMFSIEEGLQYANRFEEGYDLFDPKYEAWVKVNHPEAAGKSSTNIFSPSAPVTPLKSQVPIPVLLPVHPLWINHHCPFQALLKVLHTSSSSLAASTKHSPFSDLLTLASTPKMPKTGKACVLNSSECLCHLKEKEDQKQQVAEEKEMRKLERELKKKQREEEQKRKADERACKTDERAQERARKADEQAPKAAEREVAKAKKAEKQKAAPKREATSSIHHPLLLHPLVMPP